MGQSKPQFTYVVESGVAVIAWDSGGMNVLSSEAVDQLSVVIADIAQTHAVQGISAAVLCGNKFGLGAGADIGELMTASADDLSQFIDRAHTLFLAIENCEVPIYAAVHGVCMGGVYELALACHGIIATADSSIGLPEINLNIIPGAGGTQRLVRRAGVAVALDVILSGKPVNGDAALKKGMIDAVVPTIADLNQGVAGFVASPPNLNRTPHESCATATAFREAGMAAAKERTRGRKHPAAPFFAVQVIAEGAGLSLTDGIALEKRLFLELATSPEGKAGMRHFFTGQHLRKPPKEYRDAKPRVIKRVGIAGADGFMGNAFAFLMLMAKAGYEVVGYVPSLDLTEQVRAGIGKKCFPLVQRGKLAADSIQGILNRLVITDKVEDLAGCDIVIESLLEDDTVKGGFFRQLGAVAKPTAVVGSNSSSIGPERLVHYFVEGGGDGTNFVSAHGFSPYEHPAMSLAEIIRSRHSSNEAIVTMFSFMASLGKQPVVVNDVAAGYWINATLFVYALEAEAIYREGTPLAAIDEACLDFFPVGPFTLLDNTGLPPIVGSYSTLGAERGTPIDSVVFALAEQGRLGRSRGDGFYAYDEDGKSMGEWGGLADLVPNRSDRIASADEIRNRLLRAMFQRGIELVAMGAVEDEATFDWGIVTGLGFAMEYGGPIAYGTLKGWDLAEAA